MAFLAAVFGKHCCSFCGERSTALSFQAANGFRESAGWDPKEKRALAAGCSQGRCCTSVGAQVSCCSVCWDFHPPPSLADNSPEPVQWKVPLVMTFCHFDPCLTAAAEM